MHFGSSSVDNLQTVANWQWLGCYKSDWNNGIPVSDDYQENNSQTYFARGNVPIRGYIDFGKDPNMADGIFWKF